METIEKQCGSATVTEQRGDVLYLEGLACLQRFLEHTGDTTKSYLLLLAWVKEEQRRVSEGKAPGQYGAESLRACLGETGDSPATRWLSPLWKKLEDFADRHGKGLEDIAKANGYSGYCLPRKQASMGGAGNTSKYFFEFVERPIGQCVLNADQELSEGEFYYIQESQIQPIWYIRGLLKAGYKLQGWRRWLFGLYGVFIFLFGGASVFVAYLALAYTKMSVVELAKMFIAVGAICWSCWMSLRPFLRLIDWRIIMAPEHFIAYKEDSAQIELFRHPNGDGKTTKEIRLVRYTARCPICSAKVLLADGEKEFPNRLVGRCEESPAEHVFSFDRVRKVGRSLR